MITIAMEAMKEEETKEETPGRPQNTEGSTTEALSLRLPGRTLYLTPLLKAKKFRMQKKCGALSAWKRLSLENWINMKLRMDW